MSQYPNPTGASRPYEQEYGVSGTGIVVQFMNAVYAWMCVGLAVTALVAWYVSQQPQLVQSVFSRGTFLVLVVAELALVWIISAAINRISAAVATMLFVAYAALNGVTFSVIFLAYDLPSIGGTFLVTAGTFGVMSAIGFITKKDLSAFGSFLLMGLIGLVLASFVNLFWANSTLYWATTYIGIFIFVGLTVYDTQKLKQMALSLQDNPALANRMAVVGSLSLYLDFINLFLYLLRLLGKRR